MTDTSTTNIEDSSAKSSAPDRGVEELKAAVVSNAHDVKDGLGELAHDVVAQAKEGTASQLGSGKKRAADGLRDVASALRSAGDSSDNDVLNGYIGKAAAKVSDASDYLENHSLSEISSEVKTFARREPALFLGGALVLGLIGGRFLKASTPDVAATGGGSANASLSPRPPMRSTQASFPPPPPYPASTRSGFNGDSAVDTQKGPGAA